MGKGMTSPGHLVGAQLDFAVGRALGRAVEIDGTVCILNLPYDPMIGWGDFIGFSPSTQWGLAGPIIEKYEIELGLYERGFGENLPPPEMKWVACMKLKDDSVLALGPTPLIAAMRAFVAQWERENATE